jgi:hypothetical protein
VRTRSTIEVLEDHLERRERGDIESDLEHNYAEDVVLLCEHGALKGRGAVRNSAKALVDRLPGARFQYPVKAVDGDHALLHWSAQSASASVDLGVDTFVIPRRSDCFTNRSLPTETRIFRRLIVACHE